MNQERTKLIAIIFLSVFIVFVFWLKGIPNNQQRREYIKQEFKNGKVIEIPVDESITKDNWECTGDCSGHNAGYSWAEDKGITDPSDCSGKSQSFIEGCEAYANDQ